MRINHQQTNFFFKEFYYPNFSSSYCLHVISLICWLLMLLISATIIGITNTSFNMSFSGCADDQQFCSHKFNVTSTVTLSFYSHIEGSLQYNRIFLDGYSLKQIHGQLDNTNYCPSHYTYESINATHNSGGYRVPSTAHLHPCGSPMQFLFNDTIYILSSQGSAVDATTSSLILDYNQQNYFSRRNSHQLSQWIDVHSDNFVNWFTVPLTGNKYQLLNKYELTPDEYEMVIYNNYPTNGKFKKNILISDLNYLGTSNPLISLTLFSFAILMLLIHSYLCCRWKKVI